MSTTKVVKTVVMYLELLNDELNKGFDIFRGQSEETWGLEPSISRLPNYGLEKSFGFDDWEYLETYLIETFQNSSVPYMNFEPTPLDWLVHAQHHGLPTRLLDWTSNPLKGLYFAVNDPSYDDKNGAVFIASRYLSGNSFDYTNIKNVMFYQSKHLNNRIIAQEGCFSVYPLPTGFEKFNEIREFLDYQLDEDGEINLKCKVIIPKECKSAIRQELRILGITQQSLFPGLDGIAGSIVNPFYY